MHEPRPTVIFDLDGTLVDSQQDIVTSFLHGFLELGLPAPSREAVVASIGKPLEVMYAEFAPPTMAAALSDVYRRHYPQHFTDTTAPYEGVPALLSELAERGYARVVATTKRTAMATALVEAVGLTPLLDHVQGTDDLPAKPAPDVLLRAVSAVLGTGVLMVGDTVADIRAGAAAGLPTYGVMWGSGTRAALEAAGADLVRPDLNGIWELLGRGAA